MLHREVVEERQWIREEEFQEALSFCILLPGPEAQQLATWLGWRLHGWRGGVAEQQRALHIDRHNNRHDAGGTFDKFSRQSVNSQQQRVCFFRVNCWSV